MPKFKPLKYRDVIKVLKLSGFSQLTQRSSSHQTWVLMHNNKHFSVTVPFHGSNEEFKPGTLLSIIRQSGMTKEKFYSLVK